MTSHQHPPEKSSHRTSVIDVGQMLSPLSARGVEKQLAKLPGIHHVDVNYVAGSATVMYDESVIDLRTIKAKVEECGHHCSGELLPRHVCESVDPPGEAVAAMRAPGST